MSALPAQNVIPLETEPQPVPSKAVLYAKLARVMGKVTRVTKSGSNPNLAYKFATAPDVYDTVRVALAEENVAFFPTMLEVKPEIVTTTKEYNGKTETKQTKRIHITFEFTFACGDTGAVKTCIWESEADDNQGKGIGSAATYAIKYFLIGTFLVSTGDVDDADSDAPPVEDKPAKPKQERRIDTSKGAPPPADDKPLEPGNVDKATGEITDPDPYANLRAAITEMIGVESITPRDTPGTVRIVLVRNVTSVAKFREWLEEKFDKDALLNVSSKWVDMKWPDKAQE